MSGKPTAPILILLLCSGWEPLWQPDPRVAEGNRLLRDGKPDKALEAYAAAQAPADPGVRMNRGLALSAQGKHEPAIEELLAASQAPSHRAQAFYGMGNALARMERWGEAANAYRRALRVDPSDVRARWNLEVALRKLKAEQAKQCEDGSKESDDGQSDKDDQSDKSDDEKKDEPAQDRPPDPQDPKDDNRESGAAPPQPAEEPPRKPQPGDEPTKAPDDANPEAEPPPGAAPGEPIAPPADKPTADKEGQAKEPPSSLDAVLDALDRVDQSDKNLQIERLRRLMRSRRVEKDW
jgi:Ca-activated chloride channel family protein